MNQILDSIYEEVLYSPRPTMVVWSPRNEPEFALFHHIAGFLQQAHKFCDVDLGTPKVIFFVE